MKTNRIILAGVALAFAGSILGNGNMGSKREVPQAPSTKLYGPWPDPVRQKQSRTIDSVFNARSLWDEGLLQPYNIKGLGLYPQPDGC